MEMQKSSFKRLENSLDALPRGLLYFWVMMKSWALKQFKLEMRILHSPFLKEL